MVVLDTFSFLLLAHHSFFHQWYHAVGLRISLNDVSLPFSIQYLLAFFYFPEHILISDFIYYWSTGSGFDLIGPSSQSSKHLCIFGLYGAM